MSRYESTSNNLANYCHKIKIAINLLDTKLAELNRGSGYTMFVAYNKSPVAINAYNKYGYVLTATVGDSSIIEYSIPTENVPEDLISLITSTVYTLNKELQDVKF